MNIKLKLKELEEKVERLTHNLNVTTDNLYLLMNFVNKTTVAVKFDPYICSNLCDHYAAYRVYYFSGDNIKCTTINSLYSFSSKNWNKQVPYRITREDDKAIIIEFDYPKNLGRKTYLIDRIKGTLTDITL